MSGQFTKLDDLRRGLLLSKGLRALDGYELVDAITPGYRGKETDIAEGPWIVERIVPGKERLATWTLILRPDTDEESAHQRFVRLSGKRDILRFADRYGHLGLADGPAREGKGRLLARHTLYLLLPAESLQRWEVEIARMAALRAIWTLHLQGFRGEQRLRDLVVWETRRGAVYIQYGWILDGASRDRLVATDGRQYEETVFPDVGLDQRGRRVALFREKLASEHELRTEGEYADWSTGDASVPARAHLFAELNRQCQAVPPHLSLDGRIALCPPTVLATLYLLFMVEVAEWEPNRRQCPGCLRFFTPPPDARRDRKYCGEACRKKRFDRENRSKAARTARTTM